MGPVFRSWCAPRNGEFCVHTSLCGFYWNGCYAEARADEGCACRAAVHISRGHYVFAGELCGIDCIRRVARAADTGGSDRVGNDLRAWSDPETLIQRTCSAGLATLDG